jgi:hypothetical protein
MAWISGDVGQRRAEVTPMPTSAPERTWLMMVGRLSTP